MVTAATLPLLPDLAGRELDKTMVEVQEFETFVRRYQNMVFSVAARIIGNFADAEDITQEVFIKAFDRFGELQQSKTAGGWLKTVATNLSINHLNRYRARWRFFFGGRTSAGDRGSTRSGQGAAGSTRIGDSEAS